MTRVTSLLLCALCLLGCDPDPEPGNGNLDADWELVAEDLPEALLSVWAGDGLVYAVGADKGQGPAVLRLRDGGWERLATGERGDLWWVERAPDGTFWMVGEGGLVLRHDSADDSFTRLSVNTDLTLYGVHFAAGGEGWIVGGDPDADSAAVLLRGDAGGFAADPAFDASAHPALFKVWVQAEDLVWFVGVEGTLLRFDGSAYESLTTGTRDRLLTVRGAPGESPLMVGGQNNARLLVVEGDELVDRSLEVDEGFAPALNGVAVAPGGHATVAGNRGFVASASSGGAWQVQEALTEQHLHAVAVEDSGEAWAVGGAILTDALDRGVLLHRGERSAPAL